MVYPGNIGIMELVAFYKKASEDQKSLMRRLQKSKQYGRAWELVESVSGVKLAPMGV